MSDFDYDITIIGGGSAGLTAARVATAFGKRACLIDKERLGGDCLHYGCIPSKSLIHAAKIVKTDREAASLGEYPDDTDAPFKVDMAKVARRIQDIIGRVGAAEQSYVEGVEVRFGKAQFKSAHEVELDGQIITSRNFVIATGSRPRRPQGIPGLTQTGYLTNENVFDLRQLPSTLVIVGGGPAGVELAQAFARLGSKVTILQRASRILPNEEPEVSEAIAGALEQDGVRILTGVQLLKAGRNRQGLKAISFTQGEQTLQTVANNIIVAIGRSPNVDGLNLEAAGVKYSAAGVEVNDYLQTSASHIYAAGDVIGDYIFTHVAAYQAGIAARNAIVPVARKKADYGVLPWVTFTDPEAARVGFTEAQARQYHPDLRVKRFEWHNIDRAQTSGETAGFIKLVLDRKGEEILGAHLVGAQAGEILAEVTLAMQHKLGISGLVGTIHAYPTLANGLQSAAFDTYLESIALARSRKMVKPVPEVTD